MKPAIPDDSHPLMNSQPNRRPTHPWLAAVVVVAGSISFGAKLGPWTALSEGVPQRLHPPGCLRLRLFVQTGAAFSPSFSQAYRRAGAGDFVVAVGPGDAGFQRQSALRAGRALGVGCLLGRRPGQWAVDRLAAGRVVEFSRSGADPVPGCSTWPMWPSTLRGALPGPRFWEAQPPVLGV